MLQSASSATVLPFTEKQIELVTTFADQAVIAIENTRLFEAEQARTAELQASSAELAQSLEYQTAISNVLDVISRSPNEVQPVLDTIVTTARRLCDAERAIIWRPEGEAFRAVAYDGLDPSRIAQVKQQLMPTGRGSMAGRAVEECRAVHVQDVTADPSLSATHDFNRAGNIHTALAVPLLLKGEPAGAITVSRTVVSPFNEKQIELLKTFADQAVIAIENTRLFEEVQARTRELTEALEQQTATSEVLERHHPARRASWSLCSRLCWQNATRLCEAKFGNSVSAARATHFRIAAMHNAPPR